MESALGDSSCLEVNEDPSLNPKCVTMSDWIEAKSKEIFLAISLNCIKPKNCSIGKVRKQITQKFLKQSSKLFLRNGILYHKDDTQEIDCPDWNSMQLGLCKAIQS